MLKFKEMYAKKPNKHLKSLAQICFFCKYLANTCNMLKFKEMYAKKPYKHLKSVTQIWFFFFKYLAKMTPKFWDSLSVPGGSRQ